MVSDLSDLELLVASRTPIIAILSHEEGRVVDLLLQVATRRHLPVFRWAVTESVRRLDGEYPAQRMYLKPADALAYFHSLSTGVVLLLLDFHPYLEDPLNVRLLRELAEDYARVPKTLVLVSHELPLPPELVTYTARFDLAMPSSDELEAMVREEVLIWEARKPGRRVTARRQALSALTRNLAGLTLQHARQLTRNAIYDDGVISEADISSVMQEKYELLDQGGALSFELETAKLADVVGLVNLKSWLEKRKPVFLGADIPPGLDPPKGLLLLGVQGSGKSLAAKAVAGAWSVPLLRLDFASLYDKYYGETERKLRESLRTAEHMAPCVLWVDEIEKGLAVDEDAGPSRRLLGTLLTWMAERKAKVFLVATANDIAALPPELLRKGRFDEIFFVDLPARAVREGIFELHLRKRGQDPSRFDLPALATAAEGFSGAEIEQALVSALYSAHAKRMPLSTELVKEELSATRPPSPC
ncbi:MAG: AAA family ATPase [Gammaproteobacteria bacterium]